MMRLLLLLVGLGALAPAAGAQHRRDFAELAREQQQIAHQARRLESLLIILEERARADGQTDRADLLAAVRGRLEAGDRAPLAELLETVVADLDAERVGVALDLQQDLIAELEALLEELLAREIADRLEEQLENAQQQAAAFADLAAEQERLLSMTGLLDREQEQLQQERAATQTDAERAAWDEKSDALAAEQSDLAAQQRDLAERVAMQAESMAAGDPAATPLRAAEGEASLAAAELAAAREEPESTLDSAQEHQERAAKELRTAQEQASEQAEALEQEKKRQEFEALAEQVMEILKRHQAVGSSLQPLVGTDLSRKGRATLRDLAREERALADLAAEVLVPLQAEPSQAVPFLVEAARDDHRRLADRLDAPRYRADEMAVLLFEQVEQRWLALLDALLAKAEEPPRSTEQTPPGQGKSRLVSTRAELLLFRQLQTEVRDGLSRMEKERVAYEAAGIPLDRTDQLEVEYWLKRQERVAELYEAWLLQMMEAQP